MVALYVGGNKIGTMAAAEKLLPGLLAERQEIEVRNDAGVKIGTIVSAIREPICPWEPTLTTEEIDRRIAEGGTSLAEFWKKMGVQ